VLLLGALSAGEVAGWLRAADLFVCCSAYEGMPIAVLEALATGVPVVTNGVGEISRVVHDGVNGIVVKTDTARAFGRAIAEALHLLDAFRPACRPSVAPYAPEVVLRRLYDNHREQLTLRSSSKSKT
jgi:glycosyltransferase involved in cell wall biosynthesis